jgi:hypothetical protein
MSSRKGVFLSENCGADRGTGWRLLLRLREFRVIFDPYNNSGCQIYMSVNRFQTVVDVKNLATAKTEAKAQECPVPQNRSYNKSVTNSEPCGAMIGCTIVSGVL